MITPQYHTMQSLPDNIVYVCRASAKLQASKKPFTWLALLLIQGIY